MHQTARFDLPVRRLPSRAFMMRMNVGTVLLAALIAAGCGGSSEDDGSPTGPSGVGTPGRSCAPPAAPENLKVTAIDTRVTLTWSPVAGVNEYFVLIGSRPSSSDVMHTNTGQTTHQWTSDLGTYYARVAARNACGTGRSSDEEVFTVTSEQ